MSYIARFPYTTFVDIMTMRPSYQAYNIYDEQPGNKYFPQISRRPAIPECFNCFVPGVRFPQGRDYLPVGLASTERPYNRHARGILMKGITPSSLHMRFVSLVLVLLRTFWVV